MEFTHISSRIIEDYISPKLKRKMNGIPGQIFGQTDFDADYSYEPNKGEKEVVYNLSWTAEMHEYFRVKVKTVYKINYTSVEDVDAKTLSLIDHSFEQFRHRFDRVLPLIRLERVRQAFYPGVDDQKTNLRRLLAEQLQRANEHGQN